MSIPSGLDLQKLRAEYLKYVDTILPLMIHIPEPRPAVDALHPTDSVTAGLPTENFHARIDNLLARIAFSALRVIYRLNSAQPKLRSDRNFMHSVAMMEKDVRDPPSSSARTIENRLGVLVEKLGALDIAVNSTSGDDYRTYLKTCGLSASLILDYQDARYEADWKARTRNNSALLAAMELPAEARLTEMERRFNNNVQLLRNFWSLMFNGRLTKSTDVIERVMPPNGKLPAGFPETLLEFWMLQTHANWNRLAALLQEYENQFTAFENDQSLTHLCAVVRLSPYKALTALATELEIHLHKFETKAWAVQALAGRPWSG